MQCSPIMHYVFIIHMWFSLNLIVIQMTINNEFIQIWNIPSNPVKNESYTCNMKIIMMCLCFYLLINVFPSSCFNFYNNMLLFREMRNYIYLWMIWRIFFNFFKIKKIIFSIYCWIHLMAFRGPMRDRVPTKPTNLQNVINIIFFFR